MRFTRLVRRLRSIRHEPRDLIRAGVVVLIAGPAVVSGVGVAAFALLPLPAVVPDPLPGAIAQTSYVYAADGSLLGTFHAEHNRQLIRISDMPQHLLDAAVAAEDSRFYGHRGLDLKAIGRAFLADIRAREIVQGGSTITQQYVKNAYIEKPKRNVFRKLREALLASQVERNYSKRAILERYLNTVYLGRGAYGVEAAAKTYLGKRASQLNASESALLVGLIRAPIRYSPHESPKAAEARRLFVITRMRDLGYLSGPQAAAARRNKPKIVPSRQEVFRFPWFVDAVRRDLIRRYPNGERLVFSGGLRIRTTVDPKLQTAAERIVAETLPLPDDPFASLVAIEPRTGYVRALVTGEDHYTPAGFNIATDGRARPGSSFKTFALVAALESGLSPQSRWSGPGVLHIPGWGNSCSCVSNFANRGWGNLSLEWATVQSVNTVYAQVAVRVGARRIVDAAVRMGIKRSTMRPDVANASIAIGGLTKGVSPLEMASAYATLAAGGTYRAPKLVSRVVDAGGNVIESGPSSPRQALDPSVASAVNDMLEKTMTYGPARRGRIDRPSAAKTGTDQDFRNAAYAGYTPDLATYVLMGYRDSLRPLANVHGIARVDGSSMPADIWREFMEVALRDVPPSDFSYGGPIRPRQEGFALPYRHHLPRPEPSPSPTPSPSPSPSPIASRSPSPSPTPTPTQVIPLPGSPTGA